ncbi:unnamed protein product, partial [Ectocarpus sp. 13 AM-2016]
PPAGRVRFHRSRHRSGPRSGGLVKAVPLVAGEQRHVDHLASPDRGPVLHAVHHLGVHPPLRLLRPRPVHGHHGHGLPDHDPKAARSEGRALAGGQHRRLRHLGRARAAHRLPDRFALCPVRHPVGGELRDGGVP